MPFRLRSRLVRPCLVRFRLGVHLGGQLLVLVAHFGREGLARHLVPVRELTLELLLRESGGLAGGSGGGRSRRGRQGGGLGREDLDPLRLLPPFFFLLASG